MKILMGNLPASPKENGLWHEILAVLLCAGTIFTHPTFIYLPVQLPLSSLNQGKQQKRTTAKM